MKYSGRRYKDFPPWARTEEFIPNLGELALTDIVEKGPLPPTSFSDYHPVRDGIVDEVRAELDPPPATADEKKRWAASSP